MQYQQFLVFFIKKQVPTKDIENDGSTKNDNNEISNIIQSGECTNEEASDDDKNTEVNIETVSLLQEKNVTTIYCVQSFQVTTNDASEHHPITSSANISSIKLNLIKGKKKKMRNIKNW